MTDPGEKVLNTNPKVADTDRDGPGDKAEVTGSATTRYRHRATDPLRSDSARDGLKDGVEAKGFVNKVWHKVFESTPLKTDSDRDGLRDKVGVTVRRTRSTVTSRPTRSTAIPTTEARPDGTEIRNGANPAKRGA